VDDLARTVQLEFLGMFVADQTDGSVRSLAEYLRLFPSHEELVAAAYLEGRRGLSQSPPAAAEPSKERVGPFRLVRELGRGAQGAVWLAEDDRLGRAVALKLVPRSPLFDSIAPRFEREARVAAKLDHAGICSVLDVGADERFAWIAMRLVEGETLAARIARGEVGSIDERLVLLERVARALHAAHEAGVVHRDVKPANVMVTPRGEPVILDFGVARADGDVAPLTLTGDAIGTPAYMAPEALRGDGRRGDRRVDVWSLGVTAYELATGRRPFDAPTRDALVRAILDDDAPHARAIEPSVSDDLAVVLATALERDLARRYQTALDLAEDFRRVREREPIRARPASAALRVRRWAQRNPKLAASLAALLVVLVVALAVTSRLLSRTSDALDAKATVLRDVAQLSDQTFALELIAEEAVLWPASSAMLGRIDDWLARAGTLAERRTQHEQARSTIATRTDLDPDPERNAAAQGWLLQQLDKLVVSLGELEALRPSVQARREFAESVRERTVDAFKGEWRRAAAEIAADPRYEDLELAPQVGLVPLGRDPASGWQEFAHLESGAPPARDPATGVLAFGENSSIVFVLLPPGSFNLGCEPPGDSKSAGSANVDPWAARWDGPVTTVELDAFFISKYEMTQGQWLRHAGANAAVYQAPSKLISTDTPLLHPVEGLSWRAADRALRELQLSLPTEAQWEYAARAGTTSVWFTGDLPESLQGFANVADRFAREHEGPENWLYDLELDDGWTAHAPVGRFRANAFGLHDVHGNVEEWCLDTWEDLSLARPRAGDGLFPGTESSNVLRGGSFSGHPIVGRSGYRSGYPPTISAPNWGLRPARRVE